MFLLDYGTYKLPSIYPTQTTAAPLTTAPIFAKIIRDNVVRKRSMQQAPTERDTHRLEGVLARQWQKVASKQRF